MQLGGNSGNNISTYSLDFYHQGRLVGILITISLLFLWIFCPAGPLGGTFYNDSVIFYLVFMPRRAAWRECRYQFHYVFLYNFYDPNLVNLFFKALRVANLVNLFELEIFEPETFRVRTRKKKNWCRMNMRMSAIDRYTLPIYGKNME